MSVMQDCVYGIVQGTNPVKCSDPSARETREPATSPVRVGSLAQQFAGGGGPRRFLG